MAAADVEFRCFVGGLSWSTDDRSLKDAFRAFGEVMDSKVVSDRETGRSRGFGFVTFTDEQAMKDAIEGMNGRDLDGRNITVNRAQAEVEVEVTVEVAVSDLIVVTVVAVAMVAAALDTEEAVHLKMAVGEVS